MLGGNIGIWRRNLNAYLILSLAHHHTLATLWIVKWACNYICNVSLTTNGKFKKTVTGPNNCSSNIGLFYFSLYGCSANELTNYSCSFVIDNNVTITSTSLTNLSNKERHFWPEPPNWHFMYWTSTMPPIAAIVVCVFPLTRLLSSHIYELSIVNKI